MNNKKTTILGLITILALGGIIWYATSHREGAENQTASLEKSLTEDQKDEEQNISLDIIVGNPEAPVTIVEYSSYTCGYCIDFHQKTLSSLIENYVEKGQVKIINRRLSPPALAIAAICAESQGKFQQADKYMYENVDSLIEESQNASSEEEVRSAFDNWINGLVNEINLDKETFTQCLSDSQNVEIINNWSIEAQEAGIEGIPAFIINNDNKISGSKPYEVFAEAIEAELAK